MHSEYTLTMIASLRFLYSSYVHVYCLFVWCCCAPYYSTYFFAVR
jgi:hypothetical protein